MKLFSLLIAFLALGFIQCHAQKSIHSSSLSEKFNKYDFTGNYPIKDLITEVPALDENSIVPVILENTALKAVFDKNSGRLVSLVSKKSGWQVQRRGFLARSFRLAVPVSGRRDNCVYGEKQSPCKVIISNENKKVVFIWDKLVSECDKNLNIKFTGVIELTDNGLQFTSQVDNNSPYTVEAVYWPYLGDLNVPKTQSKLNFTYSDYASMNRGSIYPEFNNHKGYWGVDYPTQTYSILSTHFGLLGNDLEGIYIGYQDTTDNHLVNLTFELKPGWHDASGSVPKTDSIGGKPSHMEYSIVNFAYVNSKERAILEPVIFQPYTGDWQKGADIYKSWRKTWARTLPCPEWAKKVHSWQQLHINSSEDYPRCTYKDLVGYGKECAKYGVKALQLTGWNLGGQDRGNPSHDIDPRLGTWEDLKNAIAECKKIGVEIILFSKFTWADESQPWFKKELIKYAAKDQYGNYYNYGGYQYQTAVQLAGINTRRLIPMCQLSPEWRMVADNEFKKTIDLGAAGMLYDECQHHGGVNYCFDPNHGHKIPADVFSGDILLENGFRKISAQKSPEFLFAGEGIRDLQFRSYNVSYFRIGRDHIPMHRYVAPEALMMMHVTGCDEKYSVNQALLYRYIISYEPRYFKGHLDEIPVTMEYGRKVEALRMQYSDFLWDGEFMGTVGAKVKVKNDAKVIYSVFINHKTNKKAIVVANPLYDQPITVQAELENTPGGFLMASPEISIAKKSDGKAEIPAFGAVVFMEK